MNHPNQATLALHAGGDLGPLARWKLERHLARCGHCRDEVAAFQAMRELLPEISTPPEVHWNRLAAEMKANIRLGLAAGECVRAEPAPLRDTPLFAGVRNAVALASVLVLLVTGVVLQHPAPKPETAAAEGVEFQTTAHGIQVREGGGTLRLLDGGAQDFGMQIDGRLRYVPAVTYTPGAQGSMGAGYMDPQTGYMTVTNVYAD
jgi:anti-sigma factor RsiW